MITIIMIDWNQATCAISRRWQFMIFLMYATVSLVSAMTSTHCDNITHNIFSMIIHQSLLLRQLQNKRTIFHVGRLQLMKVNWKLLCVFPIISRVSLNAYSMRHCNNCVRISVGLMLWSFIMPINDGPHFFLTRYARCAVRCAEHRDILFRFSLHHQHVFLSLWPS